MVNSKPQRNLPVIGAIVGAVALIAALYFFLFVADDMGGGTGGDYGNSVEASDTAEARQMFAMSEVNIRDKPTTAGSAIIGKLSRGGAVTGVVKAGPDGIGEWLQLADGKGFIAVTNLSDIQPPEIAKALDDKVWTADTRLDIWAQPDTASTLVDQVGEGTKLTLSGLTANDFIEVKLRNGGVGYLAGGADILARLGGKPVAFSFNPATCNFGGEIGAEFEKLSARVRAQWEALENREYANDEAREKAYAAVEGKSTYARLQRSFEGLSLTAIGLHYESQSVYFADPPAKVIEVFRNKGFRIDGNGNFPSTELYAGISATRGEGTAYGNSDLGCGV